MTVKKSPSAERTGSYDGSERRLPTTATDIYVEQLWKERGSYARPAREARAVVDKSAGSLTDALYESRRDKDSK